MNKVCRGCYNSRLTIMAKIQTRCTLARLRSWKCGGYVPREASRSSSHP